MICHSRSLDGFSFFFFFSQIKTGSCKWVKAATCFCPETIRQVFRVTMLSSVGTIFTLAVMGVWRREFHTLDNLGEARKRETTATSIRAEVLVCVKKSKGKLVTASDSWLTKRNKITKAVQDFIWIVEIMIPCCAPFTTYFGNPLSFQTFFLKRFFLYVVKHCNL